MRAMLWTLTLLGMGTVIIAALILAAPLAAQYQNGRSAVPDVKEFSKGIENFSYGLLLKTATSAPDTNVVISPFSVWTMMAILGEGANGVTRDEILHTLGYPIGQSSKLSTVFGNIAPYLFINTPTVQLETINSIFYHHKASINTNYEQLVRDVYSTIFRPLDFAQEDSADKVNRFISKATHDRITKIVSRTDLKDARLLITNAMFFSGRWTHPFNASATQKGVSFYNDLMTEIGKVNMMYQRGVIPFVNMKSLKARIIELPYGQENEKQLSMIIILPNQNVSLGEVMEGFTRVPVANIFTDLEEASKRFEEDEIDVFLPRFSVTSDIILNQVLMNMGSSEVFDPQKADLFGLSPERLHLSRIIQKAQIEVTEEGTVASAVTAGELNNRNTPPKFIANRPFIYLVVEKTTNLFLIGGIYAKPSIF